MVRFGGENGIPGVGGRVRAISKIGDEGERRKAYESSGFSAGPSVITRLSKKSIPSGSRSDSSRPEYCCY